MNRREFLKAGAGAAAGLALGTALAPHVSGAADDKPLRVGLIGTGWYGKNDLFRLIQVAPTIEVVSMCDVDRQQLEDAAAQVAARLPSAASKKPRLYKDYREMLKEKDLDVCLIGTPDHWHALTMIAACEAGCDVYVQKPISTDVREGEAMVAAARKLGRVVQVGMQRRSTPHLVEARDKVLKAGLLGTIGHADICCYFHMRNGDNPPDGAKVPDTFDYEMWTGPAPLRPFDQMPHIRWWRAFMEYGNGIVGDMCVHMLDTTRWMLDLGWPSKVTSHGGILVQREAKSNITDTQVATFEFDKPRLNVSWTHRTWGNAPDPDYPWAVFVHGDKGTLKASTERWDFFPAGKREPAMGGKPLLEDKYPEEKTEKNFEPHAASATRQHMRDFLAARANRSKPVADIEQGHISAASCILANVAMQIGREIRIDPATGQLTGDGVERVKPLLARPYRGEWKHPGGAGEWRPWDAARELKAPA
jgi:predicted dehydrogenase